MSILAVIFKGRLGASLSMARTFRWCLLAGAAAFGVAFLAFYPARRVSAQEPPSPALITVKPFIATIREQYYDPSGKLARTGFRSYARFSDRSFVNKPREGFPKETEYAWEIFDVTAGRKVIVDPMTKSVTTMNYPRSEVFGMVTAMESQSCTDSLVGLPAGGTSFGHQTLRVVLDDMGHRERWIIPELDCFAVKEVMTKGGAHNDFRVISLEEGEPSRDWMAIPADYAERSPSTIEKLRRQVGEPLFPPPMVYRLTREYEAHRTR